MTYQKRHFSSANAGSITLTTVQAESVDHGQYFPARRGIDPMPFSYRRTPLPLKHSSYLCCPWPNCFCFLFRPLTTSRTSTSRQPPPGPLVGPCVSSLHGHSRLSIPNRSSGKIKLAAAEQRRFIMPTQQWGALPYRPKRSNTSQRP